MSAEKLTATVVLKAKPRAKPYKLFDGRGLYLQVASDGRRYWRYKYRIDGKEKLLSLGVYPDVPLASHERVDKVTGQRMWVKGARELHEEARILLRSGIDPSRHRKQQKAANRLASSNTFEAIAKEWLRRKAPTWGDSHARIIKRRLENDAFPAIGSEPVAALTGPRLLEVLRKIESRGAIDTAHRVRQYMDAIFRYAVHGQLLGTNPTPHPEVLTSRTPERFASITDPAEIGKLLLAIDGYQGTQTVRLALQIAPHVFVRPGELRTAEWAEIDLEQAEWIIPASKMKARRPHLVPLSVQVVELLAEQRRFTGAGQFVFPGERTRKRPISNNTLLAALRTLGYSKEQMTPHGFRHMASTLLYESREFRTEVIERQLAHADKNTVRAVYNLAEYLHERRQMMQWWSDKLVALAATRRRDCDQ